MNKGAIEGKTIGGTLYEEGLSSYILRVFNYMATGLTLTGIVAYVVSRSEPLMQIIFGTPLFWVVLFAPFGVLFFLSGRI